MGVGLFSQVTRNRRRGNGFELCQVKIEYWEKFLHRKGGQTREKAAQGSGGISAWKCSKRHIGGVLGDNLVLNLTG